MRFVLMGICVILLHVESAELQTRRDVCAVHAASDLGGPQQCVFERFAKVKDENEEDAEEGAEAFWQKVLGASGVESPASSVKFINEDRIAARGKAWIPRPERLSLLGRLLV
ncbi:MAG: hypothetical protein R3C18_11695 [Planctomycetaceae bacterium]